MIHFNLEKWKFQKILPVLMHHYAFASVPLLDVHNSQMSDPCRFLFCKFQNSFHICLHSSWFRFFPWRRLVYIKVIKSGNNQGGKSRGQSECHQPRSWHQMKSIFVANVKVFLLPKCKYFFCHHAIRAQTGRRLTHLASDEKWHDAGILCVTRWETRH